MTTVKVQFPDDMSASEITATLRSMTTKANAKRSRMTKAEFHKRFIKPRMRSHIVDGECRGMMETTSLKR